MVCFRRVYWCAHLSVYEDVVVQNDADERGLAAVVWGNCQQRSIDRCREGECLPRYFGVFIRSIIAGVAEFQYQPLQAH